MIRLSQLPELPDKVVHVRGIVGRRGRGGLDKRRCQCFRRVVLVHRRVPEAQEEELGTEALPFTSDRRRARPAADPLGRPLFARARPLSTAPRAPLLGRMRPWSQTAAGTGGLAATDSFLRSTFSVMRRRGMRGDGRAMAALAIPSSVCD